jgi:2-polyprenyl-3-methyl-5-hydroxy-6-metoxy-1,4-benzoquinol methylase
MRDLIKYTEDYLEYSFEDIQASYRKKKILELIKNKNFKCILEVGCAIDPIYNHYDNFDKLIIIEPSIHFYNIASNYILNNSKLFSRVTIINDYFENTIIELQKYEFDYVIISSLLHEIENVSSFLANLHTFIKPNTIVHVNVPNAWSFHRVLAYEMGMIDSIYEMTDNNVIFQQHCVFDMASLSEIIIKLGFEIIDSGTYFLKPFSHKQMSEMLKTKIINENTLDGFFRMTKYMPNLGSELFIEFKKMIRS